MTVLKIRRDSKEARDAYRELRNQRNLSHASQAADELPTAIIQDVINSDGLLNGPVIKLTGMKLNIPIWANTGEFEGDKQTLELFIAKGRITDVNWPMFTKVQEIPLEYPFADTWVGDYTIPLNVIQPNGEYTFKHEVVLHTTQRVRSALVHVVSDITAPYELTNPPEPPAMTFAVTDLDDTNITAVKGIIPAYTDKADGDQYVYWYASDPLPSDPSLLDPVASPADVPPDRAVTIPSDYIQSQGDGVFYVLYALIDEARNRSNLSGWTRFVVTLGALPTALKKPEVPVAAGGAVIDLETAASGVMVEIKAYTGWKSGDKIVATWGGIPLPFAFAIENGTTEISVPASTLLAAYVGATGEKTTTVSYVIDRLGRTFGPEKDDFLVNFEVVGPPNPFPDFPDPTNPNLLAGTVLGSTGNNVLVEADADKEVDFEFTIYDPVNAGETLQFFWEGTHIVEADLTITTETAGSKKTVKVPWRYVVATDNGPNKKMYYTVGDIRATPNRQYAGHSRGDLPTLISVNGKVLGTQAFDGLERMIESVTGGRRTTYVFDSSNSQPDRVIRPSGDVIAYEYLPELTEEPVKRVTIPATAALAPIEATYQYDAKNARLLESSEQGLALIRTYSSNGEVASEKRNQDGQNYQMAYLYSRAGRLLRYTDVLGQVQHYEHDVKGRMVWTELGTAGTAGHIRTDFTYNDQGLTSSIKTVDTSAQQSLTITLDYDAQGRETLRVFDFGASAQRLSQTWNGLDQVERRLLSEGAGAGGATLRDENYEYELRGRLEFYSCTGPQSPVDPYGKTIQEQEFYFDALDNLEEVRTRFAGGRNIAKYSYGYEDPAQLSAVTNSHADYPNVQLNYDDNGNLLQDREWALGYDSLGRLSTVSTLEGGAPKTYGYDGEDTLSDVRGDGSNERLFYRGDEPANRIDGDDHSTFVFGGGVPLAERQAGAGPKS